MLMQKSGFLIGAIVALLSGLCGCIPLKGERLFYNQNKKPVYLADIFEGSHEVSFCRAIMRGDLESIEEHAEDLDSLDFQGKYGITPLWFAVREQRPEIVRFLLENGASPNKEIDWVSSIVGQAAEGDPGVLRQLLEAGADPNIRSGDFQKMTPIHHASLSGKIENIDVLLKYGADINSRDSGGVPPIMTATAFRQFDAVTHLLESGADPLLSNQYGGTAMTIMQEMTLSEENEEKVSEILSLIAESKLESGDLNTSHNVSNK